MKRSCSKHLVYVAICKNCCGVNQEQAIREEIPENFHGAADYPPSYESIPEITEPVDFINSIGEEINQYRGGVGQLTHILEKIRLRIAKEQAFYPCDVSGWKRIGQERGYDKYFGIVWPENEKVDPANKIFGLKVVSCNKMNKGEWAVGYCKEENCKGH